MQSELYLPPPSPLSPSLPLINNNKPTYQAAIHQPAINSDICIIMQPVGVLSAALSLSDMPPRTTYVTRYTQPLDCLLRPLSIRSDHTQYGLELNKHCCKVLALHYAICRPPGMFVLRPIYTESQMGNSPH